jgi:hypothetical protein
VDVRIIGLPTKYANYYDGWEIEEEIEQTCSWEELEKVVHSCWGVDEGLRADGRNI